MALSSYPGISTKPIPGLGYSSSTPGLGFNPGAYPNLSAQTGITSTGTAPFNVNPAPHAGQGAYGSVPGSVALPNPASDLASQYPNLTGQNSQVSKNIMGELQGQLSPETINMLKDQAANFGVSSGMPGSGLANYGGLRNLGLETQKVQGQGLQDYLAAISGISKTQTVDPALQVSTAQQNSVWNSAPDPAAAAQEQMAKFDKYLEQLKNPAAGSTSNPNQSLLDKGWSLQDIRNGAKTIWSRGGPGPYSSNSSNW